MEVSDVLFIGAGVGGVGEDEEVVGLLGECLGVPGWDYCARIVSAKGMCCADGDILPLK